MYGLQGFNFNLDVYSGTELCQLIFSNGGFFLQFKYLTSDVRRKEE